MNNVLAELDISKVQSDTLSECAKTAASLLSLLGPRKVIEIGTSYGHQLKTFVPLSSETVCIDCMYDWVPDVRMDERFDASKISVEKMRIWGHNALPFKGKIHLIVGSSFEVWQEEKNDARLQNADILIIDGCHHPWQHVMNDYFGYRIFMNDPHYVIWDDHKDSDVRTAAEETRRLLLQQRNTIEEKVIDGNFGCLVQYIRSSDVNG